MNEGSAPLFSGTWWLTVFTVGLGIHLVASYLKPLLDQVGGWVSRSWAARSEKRSRERADRIAKLRCDEKARQQAILREFRYRLRSLIILGEAIFCFVVAFGFRQIAPQIANVGHRLAYLRMSVASELLGIIVLFGMIDHLAEIIKISSELRDADEER